jgi:hypothetical protein
LFRDVAAETAEEFLDFLLPHRGNQLLWGRADDASWMFRGVRDATWALEPAAFRLDQDGNHAFVRFTKGRRTRGHFETAPEQIAAEQAFVVMFGNKVVESGFELPGDRPELRQAEPTPGLESFGDGRDFPPPHLRWLFALGQHYGVPTRLLDWTYSSLLGAYFAVREAAERETKGRSAPGERFAVWALSEAFVRRFGRQWNPGPDIVTVPTVSNPNLHAQKGLFTLVRYLRTTTVEPKPRPPPIDRLFVDHEQPAIAAGSGLAIGVPFLFKFTAPVSAAPALLFYLHRMGVHHATVFPGLHSLKDWMLEESFAADPRRKADFVAPQPKK